MPWYPGPPLLDHLETVHIASDRNLTDLRFPVQYVIRPNLDFRGFAGTVASGILRKGDEVMVLPSGKRSRVKSIVTYDGELEEAFAPQAVTVTLTDEVDVSRGDMLVHPDNPPHVSSQIEAMVVWMAEQPLVPGRTYTLKHTTRQVAAEVASFRYGVDVNTLEHRAVARLGLNEVGHVQLSLTQPLACDPYRTNAATGAFILIDRLTNNTVGAGMILEAGAPAAGARRRSAAPRRRESLIAPAEREQRYGQVPVTVLLVGLTGSGKSRIAYALERRLWDEGRAVTVLYGQNMRQGLNRDLGFTADDRSENLRRSAEVAKLMNDAGVITIAAFVAPHEAVREKAKQVIGRDRVLEVYCTAPMEVLRARDQSGAYRLADEGKIAQMPGVTAAFEEPKIARPRAADRPDQRGRERQPHRRVDEVEGLSALAVVVARRQLEGDAGPFLGQHPANELLVRAGLVDPVRELVVPPAAEVEGPEPAVEDVHPGPVDHRHPPDRVAGKNVVRMSQPELGVDPLHRRGEPPLPLPQVREAQRP